MRIEPPRAPPALQGGPRAEPGFQAGIPGASFARGIRGLKPALGPRWTLKGTSRIAGFTLVEVLVALMLTGIVVLLAHAVLAEVSDAAARGRAVAQDLDRAGNRRSWLLRAFANVTVGSAPMRGFDGRDGQDAGRESDRVAFFTRLPVDSGDGERRVHLWRAGDVLLAEVRLPPGPRDGTPDTLVLAEGLRAFGADFLIEYGAASPWVREWVSPVSAPVAVRLRLEWTTGGADTLLLHVGARG